MVNDNPTKKTAPTPASKPASKQAAAKATPTKAVAKPTPKKAVAKPAPTPTKAAAKPAPTKPTPKKAVAKPTSTKPTPTKPTPKEAVAKPAPTKSAPKKAVAKPTPASKQAAAKPKEQMATPDCFVNTLHPSPNSRTAVKRVGRGAGSGNGKTAGRGHKGQKSRSGSRRDASFEGGQMPIQMRLPKFGFKSRIGRVTAKVCLGDLSRIKGDVVDIKSLRESKIIGVRYKRARVFLSGSVDRKFTVRDVVLSRGARAAIEQAGGKVESTATRSADASKSKD